MEEFFEKRGKESISIYYWINAIGFSLTALGLMGIFLWGSFLKVSVYYGKLTIENPVVTFKGFLLVLVLAIILIYLGTFSFRKKEWRNDFFLKYAKSTNFIFYFLTALILCQIITNSRENYSILITLPLLILLIIIQTMAIFIGAIFKKQELGKIAKIVYYTIILGSLLGISIEFLFLIIR